MSEVLEGLKAKYDQKSAEEIVDTLLTAKKRLKELQKEMILGLFYMERTRRWKEYPGYKNTSWEPFLDDLFKMRPTTYRNLLFAFQSFPVESEMYSPGVVVKIKETCGVENLPKVLREITVKDESLIRPIKREQINKIIEKYALPKTPAKIEDKTDWRQRYLAEHDIRLALERINEELKNQITKLKAALRSRPFMKRLDRKSEQTHLQA